MSEIKSHESGTQTKENNMNDSKRPEWIKSAARVDRPDIARWYKPENGSLDGVLIWRGRMESYHTGDIYNAYAIRLAANGEIVGVSERAGLRDLRGVKVGSRVFIEPAEVKDLGSGRKFQQFHVFAEGLEPLSEPTRGSGKGTGGGPEGAPAASEDVPF
jgi:hypothetical protein